MEVLSPEKWKYYPQKNKNKKRKNWASVGALARDKRDKRGRFFREQYFQNALRQHFFSGNSTSKMRCGDVFFWEQYFQNALRESGRSLSRYN